MIFTYKPSALSRVFFFSLVVGPFAVWSIGNRGIDEGWWGSDTNHQRVWCAGSITDADCSYARAAIDAGKSVQSKGWHGFRQEGFIVSDGRVFHMTSLPTNRGVWRLVAVEANRAVDPNRKD